MKPAILFAAIVGALAGAGGVALTHLQPFSARPAHELPRLTLDQGASGELTSQSHLNLSDGLRSMAFELQAQAGQLISLTASGPLQSQISVLRDGRLVARKQACEYCDDEQQNQNRGSTLGLRIDHTGPYVVAVSGIDASAYGPFQLTARAFPAYTGDPLQPGQNLTDLAMGKLKAYRLNIVEDGLYTITMDADHASMDPYLRLTGPGKRSEQLRLEDDDSGGRQNARIRAYLKAGSYILHATSAADMSTFQGPFTLGVQREALPKNLDLKDGARLSLDKFSYTGLLTGAEQNFTVALEQPTLLTLEMDAQGSGGGFHMGLHQSSTSRSDDQIQVLRAVVPAGTHTVTVPQGASGGLFSLTLAGEPAPANAGGGPIAVGERRHPVLPAGVKREIYTLTIEEEGEYLIDMRSEAFDSYLVLNRDDQDIHQDDDSGGGYDARLEAFLFPGEYLLQAVSLDNNDSPAEYELQVRRN